MKKLHKILQHTLYRNLLLFIPAIIFSSFVIYILYNSYALTSSVNMKNYEHVVSISGLLLIFNLGMILISDHAEMKLMNVHMKNTESLITPHQLIKNTTETQISSVEKHRLLKHGGCLAKTYENAITLKVYTKCPSKYLLTDLETGEIYQGTVNADKQWLKISDDMQHQSTQSNIKQIMKDNTVTQNLKPQPHE